MKKILFFLAALIIPLTTGELLAAFFAHTQKDKFTFYDINDYTVTERQINKVASVFHPVLGWKKRHGTPFGERPRERIFERNLMATFGDSFTYCAQVSAGESWQTWIAEKARANVFNFGSGGYGLDQSYLRFLEDYPKVNTRIVTLGFISENIKRTLNVYRKFYWPKTRVVLTKPRFILKKGNLALLPNPLKKPEDIAKLKDPDFIEELGRNDFWYNAGHYPERKFPYINIFFNRQFWNEVLYARAGRRADDINPRPWLDLWNDPEASAIAFAILDEFRKKAASFGAEPVIMLLPQWGDALYQFKTGAPSPAVQAIMRYAKQRNARLFNGVEAIVSAANDYEELASMYKGHLSPKGNEVIAKSFYSYLKKEGLL